MKSKCILLAFFCFESNIIDVPWWITTGFFHPGFSTKDDIYYISVQEKYACYSCIHASWIYNKLHRYMPFGETLLEYFQKF